MAKLFNLAGMGVASAPGTGTISLGGALTIAGVLYLTFAQAGVVNGDVVAYAINDVGGSEIGIGTYTSAGLTLTRTVTKSTNSNAAINATAQARVMLIARAEDIGNLGTINTWAAAQTFINSNGIQIQDTDASHVLGLILGSNLTGNRALTITTGDADRTLTLTGNFTGSGTSSGTNTGDQSSASQAQQEAGASTSVFTSPGVQQYHPSAVKVWCRFNNAAGIIASYNTASVSDNGVGDWTVNFSTGFSSSSFGAKVSPSINSFNTYGAIIGLYPSASGVRVYGNDSGVGGALEATDYTVECVGDQ